MLAEKSLNIVNKKAYSQANVVKYYQNLDKLFEAEKIIFEKLFAQINDSRILDIGVGGGRTTNFLLPISGDYTGIDYVAEFAAAVEAKYPEAKILCADATDLKEFADENFDFVLFSFNGIDALNHESRLKALREIYRVTKKGGSFAVASHNRDYRFFKKMPWHHDFSFSLGYLIFCLHCLRHLPTHFEMKKYEIQTEDYAVVNDGDHRFSLLLYYIGIEKQREQLEKIGFSEVEAYDQKGVLVEKDDRSPWIYYLAKKK